jgi:hypothetical protein
MSVSSFITAVYDFHTNFSSFSVSLTQLMEVEKAMGLAGVPWLLRRQISLL